MKIAEMLNDEQMDEISLGDYRKKAGVNKAMSQADKFFGRDDPEKVAHADRTIANRDRGIARADHRAEKQRQAMPKYEPPQDDPVELAAKLAKMKERFRHLGGTSYRYADRMSDDDREAENLHQAIQRMERSIGESASAGATSSASMGTVDAPQLSPGKASGKKSYTGSPSTGSGTKAPPQPKVVQPKNSDGTARNGLDMKGANLFGAPIKR
jgi:hypothetical protein